CQEICEEPAKGLSLGRIRLLGVRDDPGLRGDRIRSITICPTEEVRQVVVDLRVLSCSSCRVEGWFDVFARLVLDRCKRQAVGLRIAEIDVTDCAFCGRHDLGDPTVAVASLSAFW